MSTGPSDVADETIITDVCVVGAGPAGLTVANDLGSSGLRVCLLESGGIDVERGAQHPSRGESTGYPLTRLDLSRVRAVGGTLRHPRIANDAWAARPLDVIDFEPLGLPHSIGWPFARRTLDPYYARAARTCGLQPEDEATSWWLQHASPAACGLATGRIAPAVFQFTNTALDQTWSNLQRLASVRLLVHTRAVDLTLNPAGTGINEILAVRGSRARVVIRARAVVLATGGIENARMLLIANGRRGIGNEHDLVGRYFAERARFHAGHLLLSDTASLDELSLFHRPFGLSVGGGLRVRDDVQRERGLNNCAFFLMPRPLAVTSDGIRALSTLRKSMSRRPRMEGTTRRLLHAATAGPALADIALGKFQSRPTCLMLRAQGEPTPDRESRVRLGTRVDDLGVPVAHVVWRPSERDQSSVRASAAVLDEALRALRLGSIVWTATPEDTLIEGNHHHLGATRMHCDPRMGVVDADCRVHSTANLFVAGSSVFPRYGASNPTLTIVALAHRLADHLCGELRRGATSSSEPALPV